MWSDTIVLLIETLDSITHLGCSGVQRQLLRVDDSGIDIRSNHRDLVQVLCEVSSGDSDKGHFPVFDALTDSYSLDLLLLPGMHSWHYCWFELDADTEVVVATTLANSDMHVMVLAFLEIHPLRELNSKVA